MPTETTTTARIVTTTTAAAVLLIIKTTTVTTATTIATTGCTYIRRRCTGCRCREGSRPWLWPCTRRCPWSRGPGCSPPRSLSRSEPVIEVVEPEKQKNCFKNVKKNSPEILSKAEFSQQLSQNHWSKGSTSELRTQFLSPIFQFPDPFVLNGQL